MGLLKGRKEGSSTSLLDLFRLILPEVTVGFSHQERGHRALQVLYFIK